MKQQRQQLHQLQHQQHQLLHRHQQRHPRLQQLAQQQVYFIDKLYTNLYVHIFSDNDNNKIRFMSVDDLLFSFTNFDLISLGSFLKWNQTGVNIAGTGSPTAGGSATSNTFKNPSWLYVDTNGTLYVSDFDNNRIQMWKNGSTNGITVAGSSTGTEGTTSSLLKRPFAVTFDNNGFMYVSEKENNRVQQFAPNSLVGTTVAGQANGQEGTTSSYLKKPTGIGVDKDQNVYIIDTVNQRVVVWPPNATSGNVLVSHNSLGDGYGLGLVPNTTNQIYYSTQGGTKSIYLWTFNATAPTITLNQVQDSANSVLKNPGNIVFDPYGNLYVPDKEPDRVVMFCTNTTVGTVVIQGTDATLKNPSSISFDSNLNMYVAMGDGSYIVRYARLN